VAFFAEVVQYISEKRTRVRVQILIFRVVKNARHFIFVAGKERLPIVTNVLFFHAASSKVLPNAGKSTDRTLLKIKII
jgi:hypothetical protein